MIKEAIIKLAEKQHLSYDESYAVMNEMMEGKTTPVQTTAFLTSLALKGETNEEISACAAGMRDHAVPVNVTLPVLDIVGTGGDHSNSFNISSTAAMVIAAAGQPVTKHGNRAASSKSGAADVMEALGVNLNQSPEQVESLLNEVGICFLYAQKYHTSMKHVASIRKELGIRTVFNILGPLTNPTSPQYQLLGVYSEALVEPMAEVLMNLGVKRGMVVFGQDVMDEISMSAPTTICEFEGNHRQTYVIKPEDFGFIRCDKSAIVGGTAEENASIIKAILSGTDRGSRQDIVSLNAGAALYIAGKAKSFTEGIQLAQETINSGKAMALLERFIETSNQGQEVIAI